MKWLSKPTPPPKIGDKRVLRKFAWFPVEIGNYKVWLETYAEEQEFVEDAHEFCNDCHSPILGCDQGPRKYWKVVERAIMIPYC